MRPSVCNDIVIHMSKEMFSMCLKYKKCFYLLNQQMANLTEFVLARLNGGDDPDSSAGAAGLTQAYELDRSVTGPTDGPVPLAPTMASRPVQAGNDFHLVSFLVGALVVALVVLLCKYGE